MTALQVLTLANVKDSSNKMCMHKRTPPPLLRCSRRTFFFFGVVRSLAIPASHVGANEAASQPRRATQ